MIDAFFFTIAETLLAENGFAPGIRATDSADADVPASILRARSPTLSRIHFGSIPESSAIRFQCLSST